jgi:hypothetical protein
MEAKQEVARQSFNSIKLSQMEAPKPNEASVDGQ